MRNLKRVLSLTLASVMLMGMMVVGSSAAAGYDDVAETDNVEAIEVLQAIEVMVGDERGFGPERPVNRAEMAVVMGKLLNLDYNYYTALCPFTDVYDWAQGWVGACYANKIVSGRGDGIYDPGATVTAVEAASMLMRALGYFQYQNDYAAGFELATVTQGKKIGIFDNVGSSASEPMTRNQVAQMVLNALQSDTVEPDGNTIDLTTPDGTVLTGKVNYVSVTRDEAFATAIKRTQATSVGSQNSGYIVELGERLYNGDLKLYEYTSDDFERPARTWEFNGKEIGTYMKKENIRETYTDGVNRRELYDLLGRSSLNDYDFHYYVDGVESTDITPADILTRTTKDYGTTGRGVLTQVFVDTEAKTIDITSINTWLAKAAADYNATRENVVLNVYRGYTDKKTVTTAKTVSLTEVPEVENVTKDQYLLVNWSGKDQASGVYEVVEISDVEILSNSTLTKFSKGDDNDPLSDKTGHESIFKSVTTGGTEYKNSKKAYYSDEALDLYNNSLLSNKTYNVYLDKYGYAIGVDLYSGDDNYIFISGIKLNNSTISVTEADANAIFTDGTAATIKVNVKDTDKNIEAVQKGSLTGKAYFEPWGKTGTGGNDWYDTDPEKAVVNRWYTYTVDKAGVYTLTPAARMLTSNVHTSDPAADKIIRCNSVVLDMDAKDANDTSPHPASGSVRIYGNDDSIYIIPELDNVSGTGVTKKVISGVDGRYTGVQDVEIDIAAHVAGTKLALGSDATEMYDSVYAVYDKNNYVIAAVVVGEAKGTSANYAYILTAAKSERVEPEDGTYYWEFDAVVDGEKQTLTVKSKFANTINSLLPGHVQELRFTDEYVTAIKNVDAGKIYTTPGSPINRDTHEVYDVGHEQNYSYVVGSGTRKSECSNTDCSFTGYTYPTSTRLNTSTAPDLHVDGRTLKLGVNDGSDWALTLVSETTPAVVIQWEDGSKETRYYSSVAAALSTLGDADGDETDGKLGFAGRITAVLNSQGVAKWVVINSDTPVNSKAGTVTGSACEIIIRRHLSDGAGSVNDLQPITVKVSTGTLETGVDGSKFWTVDAPVVSGWVPLVWSQTVKYTSGTNSYAIDFTYTQPGGAASSAADITAATATSGDVTTESLSYDTSKNVIKVPITQTRDNFDEGDTITVTSTGYSPNASVPGTAADKEQIILTYTNGVWVANKTITVRAQDGTTKEWSAVADLATGKAPSISNVSACVGTGNGTATADVSGTSINVKIVNGSIGFADNDKFTVTVAAATKGTLTDESGAPVASITVEKETAGWEASPAKVIGTAQDGKSETYTVVITTGLSSTGNFAPEAEAAGGNSGTETVTSVDVEAPVGSGKGKIKVVVSDKYSDFQDGDKVTVDMAPAAGTTADPELVRLTFTAGTPGSWDTKDVTITAPDGSTSVYTVSMGLESDTTLSASAGAVAGSGGGAATGNGTATATVEGTTLTVETTAGLTDFSNGDQFTITLTLDSTSYAVDDGDSTITSIVVSTADGTTFTADTASIKVIAQDGSSTTYTVSVNPNP